MPNFRGTRRDLISLHSWSVQSRYLVVTVGIELAGRDESPYRRAVCGGRLKLTKHIVTLKGAETNAWLETLGRLDSRGCWLDHGANTPVVRRHGGFGAHAHHRRCLAICGRDDQSGRTQPLWHRNWATVGGGHRDYPAVAGQFCRIQYPRNDGLDWGRHCRDSHRVGYEAEYRFFASVTTPSWLVPDQGAVPVEAGELRCAPLYAEATPVLNPHSNHSEGSVDRARG